MTTQSTGFVITRIGLQPSCILCQLCDLGQVTQPLIVSVPHSCNAGNNNTCLTGSHPHVMSWRSFCSSVTSISTPQSLGSLDSPPPGPSVAEIHVMSLCNHKRVGLT